jgi:glycosyltransferase involved in cell wall biosynthesis
MPQPSGGEIIQKSEFKSNARLRILYVATKPAYPPQDGGRLLIWNTLTELASRGHRITFVAPDLGGDGEIPRQHFKSVCESVQLVPGRPSPLWSSALRAAITRQPMSVLRHTHRAVQKSIRDELARCDYDVIHAEQIQAYYNLPRATDLPPVVLRAQNVESELWRMVAFRKPRAAWIVRDEARKMAAFEASAVKSAAATVVLTQPDAQTLGGGAGPESRRISVVRPPFPSRLPSCDEPLDGDPPVVLVTGGWLPNRDSLAWFRRDVWPAIRSANPGARAHIFGAAGQANDPSISFHASPTDCARLFRPGSILAVPLRIASGIRMKILEAWARGIPVVATPTAVRGLDDVGRRAFLLARDGAEFGEAISRFREDPKLANDVIVAGRTALNLEFQPHRSAEQLESIYRKAISDLS